MTEQTKQTEPSPAAMRAASEIDTLYEDHFRVGGDYIASIIQSAIDEHDRETGVAELRAAAQALLNRLDRITTDSFSNGGEHAEREALRAALGKE